MTEDGYPNFARLVSIMERLRSPGGCPWDREQDHSSIRPYIIEETYEVVDAIEEGDDEKLKEELGDLLLQIVFHARMAEEESSFDIEDVARTVCEKLIERHPHVFAGLEVSGLDEVLENWETIKRRENGRRGLLEGLPNSMPSLLRAFRIAEKVSRVRPEEVERKAAGLDDSLDEDSLGELLLGLAVGAFSAGIDPESALRRACDRWAGELGE